MPSSLHSLQEELSRMLPAAGWCVTVAEEGTVQMAGDTRLAYELGSVTKVFTALLLERALQMGLVTEESCALEILKVRSTVNRLPLRSLASHSSGLPEWPANFAPRADSLFAHYRSDELLSALAEESARALPSGQYRYSSYGPAVLGLVLATVLGMSYADACTEYVLRPAGMDKAHFGVGPGFTAFGVFGPAGALTATGRDLQAWLAHLLWPKEEAWSECLSRVERVRLVTGVNRMAMASGWHVRVGDGGPVHWHNGRTPLGGAFVGISRDRKQGVVLAASHDVDLDGLGFAWLGRAERGLG